MTETDRITMLEDLDRRHDELLGELDALARQIESTLGAANPAARRSAPSSRPRGGLAPPIQMPALINRPQEPQPKRRAKRHP
jgi:hypothetical protein